MSESSGTSTGGTSLDKDDSEAAGPDDISVDGAAIEEIARSHPSAEDAAEHAQDDPTQVADRDSDQTAQRGSDAGEDYAGSGL